MNREKIEGLIKKERCIAIVRGIPKEHILHVANALYDGGIYLIEVTFDQKSDDYRNTLSSIQAIHQEMGEKICVGAGTVITREQLLLAKEAGAQYIISPDTNVEIIKETVANQMVSIPGALTPTEAVSAYEAGASFVKIFPAGNLGASYIKSIASPLSHIPFMAVGGVNALNAHEFIEAGACGVGVGGNLVNDIWVKNREYNKITQYAQELIAKISL